MWKRLKGKEQKQLKSGYTLLLIIGSDGKFVIGVPNTPLYTVSYTWKFLYVLEVLFFKEIVFTMLVRLLEKNNFGLFSGKKSARFIVQNICISYLLWTVQLRIVIVLSFQLNFWCALFKNWIMKQNWNCNN